MSGQFVRRFITISVIALVIGAGVKIWQSAFAPDPLGRVRYKVVDRIDDPNCPEDHLGCRVKVILLRDGHRLHATALDYKAGVAGIIRHCNLRVGETVSCKFFADRYSEDAGGYNLICGSDLWHGRLTTTAANELLTIDRDELQ